MLLYLGNVVLRDADANSMAHSLEVRVPFLSRTLIECVAAIESLAACPALDAAAVRAKWRWFVDNRHRTYWDRPLAMVALGNYLRLVPSFGGCL